MQCFISCGIASTYANINIIAKVALQFSKGDVEKACMSLYIGIPIRSPGKFLIHSHRHAYTLTHTNTQDRTPLTYTSTTTVSNERRLVLTPAQQRQIQEQIQGNTL
jgi:hypothetical protein